VLLFAAAVFVGLVGSTAVKSRGYDEHDNMSLGPLTDLSNLAQVEAQMMGAPGDSSFASNEIRKSDSSAYLNNNEDLETEQQRNSPLVESVAVPPALPLRKTPAAKSKEEEAYADSSKITHNEGDLVIHSIGSGMHKGDFNVEQIVAEGKRKNLGDGVLITSTWPHRISVIDKKTKQETVLAFWAPANGDDLPYRWFKGEPSPTLKVPTYVHDLKSKFSDDEVRRAEDLAAKDVEAEF